MDSNSCISCGKLFQSAKKPIDKRSLAVKLQKLDRTVKDVLEKDLGLQFTPEQKKKRFLCQQCLWTITSYAQSHEASVQALRKVREATHGPSYLAKKLRSPIPTPRKIKKMRVLSPEKATSTTLQGMSEENQENLSPVQRKKKKLTKAEVVVNRALTYLRLRQYQRGLKLLFNTRTGAVKAFCNLIRDTVEDEMRVFLQQEGSNFGAHKSVEEWKGFSWG